MAKRETAKTHELKELLLKRFDKQAYAIVWEVGDGTGMNCSRHADALAMSLWPSRGLELMGFEIKASRSDWVKERDNPAKAEAIYKYCDKWYVVAGDSEIVKPGELPATWGLMVPRNGTLAITHEAARLTPVECDRSFLAAIFRKICQQSADAEVLEAARAKGFKEGKDSVDHGKEYELKHLRDENARLQSCVDEFAKHSGVRIAEKWGWQKTKDIGRAVAQVIENKHIRDVEQLLRIGEMAKDVLAIVERNRAELEKLATPAEPADAGEEAA